MTTIGKLQEAMNAEPRDQSIWLAIADVLEEEGQGARAELVRLWLAEVMASSKLEKNPERRRELERQRVTLPLPEYTNSIGMKFVWIPPGKFLMGATRELNPNAETDESPRHEVTLTKAFYLGVHEVTVGQFRAFVTATKYQSEAERGDGAWGWIGSNWGKDARINWMNPRFKQGEGHPVTCVSWNDAERFIEWLNQAEKNRSSGYLYRLPTEAEWEYACRGGASEFSIYHFGNTITKENANFGNHVGETTEVGKYAPNAFGLYDMHGNVWEWCLDVKRGYQDRAETDPRGPSEGTHRVFRGGSWCYGSSNCTASHRLTRLADYRTNNVGFRLCRVSVKD